MRASVDRRLEVVPVRPPVPVSLLELVLDIEEKDSCSTRDQCDRPLDQQKWPQTDGESRDDQNPYEAGVGPPDAGPGLLPVPGNLPRKAMLEEFLFVREDGVLR